MIYLSELKCCTLPIFASVVAMNLVVSDSIFALDNKINTTWLSGLAVADVVCGRRFQKGPWINKSSEGQSVAIFCAANDAVKPGPRAKQWIDDTALANVNKTLVHYIAKGCNVTFVLVGDWMFWKFGFVDVTCNSEERFEGCCQQLLQAAKEVASVRTLRWTSSDLDGAPMHDEWHFSRAAAPMLVQLLQRDFQGQVQTPPPHISCWADEDSEADYDPDIVKPKADDDTDMVKSKAEYDLDDTWRAPRITSILESSAALDRLKATGPFPVVQHDLTETTHDLLFFHLLGAAKSKGSKNKISGWRRWFGSSEGEEYWRLLRKRLEIHAVPEVSLLEVKLEAHAAPKAKQVNFDEIDDDWRPEKMQDIIADDIACRSLAACGIFPQRHNDLSPECYQVLFNDLLAVAKNSKSKNKLSGWRRWLSTEDGQSWWDRLEHRVNFLQEYKKEPEVEEMPSKIQRQAQFCSACGAQTDCHSGRGHFSLSVYCSGCWHAWRRQ